MIEACLCSATASSRRAPSPRAAAAAAMGSSPDYSKSKARSVQPSRFPADDGWLDRCDKAATRLVSSMSLPLLVECAISCPGCFFGMPAFLLVGPTIVDCLVDGAARRA